MEVTPAAPCRSWAPGVGKYIVGAVTGPGRGSVLHADFTRDCDPQ